MHQIHSFHLHTRMTIFPKGPRSSLPILQCSLRDYGALTNLFGFDFTRLENTEIEVGGLIITPFSSVILDASSLVVGTLHSTSTAVRSATKFATPGAKAKYS